MGGWVCSYKGQGFRIMPWQAQMRLRVVGVSLEIVRAGPCRKAYPDSVWLVSGIVFKSWVVGFGPRRYRLVRLDCGWIGMARRGPGSV